MALSPHLEKFDLIKSFGNLSPKLPHDSLCPSRVYHAGLASQDETTSDIKLLEKLQSARRLHHCWWGCPMLVPFWKVVHASVEQMTTCTLEFSLSQMLLQDWSQDEVYPHREKIVSTLFSLARMEITAKWKSKASPSLCKWYERIWECFVLSKIRDKILHNSNISYCSTLERDWFPILTYLAENNCFLQISGKIIPN